jgi:drug/metabolite transporter superfamily protein YnfA
VFNCFLETQSDTHNACRLPKVQMSEKSVKYWKTFAVVMLSVGGIVLNVGWFGLESHYFATLPREPNPSIGRVYPYNHHGIVFWQTQTEKRRLDLLEYMGWFLILGGMSIAYWKDRSSFTAPAPSLRLPKGFVVERSEDSIAYRMGARMRSLLWGKRGGELPKRKKQ